MNNDKNEAPKVHGVMAVGVGSGLALGATQRVRESSFGAAEPCAFDPQHFAPYISEEISMQRNLSRKFAPYVEAELANAQQARLAEDPQQEFSHLEHAHVIGQESTYWHVKVHMLMLAWAIRNHSAREALGQLLRIIGAATKTAFGLVPQGNTGGSNISPFKRMPIAPELANQIQKAKSGV